MIYNLANRTVSEVIELAKEKHVIFIGLRDDQLPFIRELIPEARKHSRYFEVYTISEVCVPYLNMIKEVDMKHVPYSLPPPHVFRENFPQLGKKCLTALYICEYRKK